MVGHLSTDICCGRKISVRNYAAELNTRSSKIVQPGAQNFSQEKFSRMNMIIKEKHKLTCHCGAVEIELSLPNGLEKPRRCDCSLCRRRGATVASVTLDRLKIMKGTDKLKLYQFNTMTAKHYFCSICGIYTHHQRRSNPSEYGFNVGCLEGVNPYELGDIPIMDGINHPSDLF